MSLSSIPKDIICNNISQYLKYDDIIHLSQVNKCMNHICNLNDMWLFEYLKCYKNLWKIDNNSIHIGCPEDASWISLCNKTRRRCNFLNKNTNFESHMKNTNYTFIKWLEKDPFIKCVPCSLLNNTTHPTFSTLRQKDEYYKELRNKCIQYNKDNNISNTQLCQNPEHYLLQTLIPPVIFPVYRDYKKIFLQHKLKDIIKSKENFNGIDKMKLIQDKILDYQNRINILISHNQEIKDKHEKYDIIISQLQTILM